MLGFAHMPLNALLKPEGFDCNCGRHHATTLKYLKIGRHAIQSVPEAVCALGCAHPMIICDENTDIAAGRAVEAILSNAAIAHSKYCFPTKARLMPAEWELGSMIMHFDPNCDLILGVGGGVINDLCKMLSRATGLPSAIVATAPSMDGFASNSGAMEVNHIKTTIYTPCPAAVICDTEIMAQAPERMLWAGIGDMAAKYISICEWRISHIVNDEYYCEDVADMMREALNKVMRSIDGIMRRDPDAIAVVAEGLVLAGMSMAFAQVSRPASGLEHCFSHIWEMMALDRKRPYDLHGLQVGIGTLLALRIYDGLKAVQPTQARLENAISTFDPQVWEGRLHRVFGGSADALISAEVKYQKNQPERRRIRAQRIIERWDDILAIINEEIPDAEAVYHTLEATGMPLAPAAIGISNRDAVDAFVCSRDIRDRYLSSSMLWDIGYLDEFADILEDWLENNC